LTIFYDEKRYWEGREVVEGAERWNNRMRRRRRRSRKINKWGETEYDIEIYALYMVNEVISQREGRLPEGRKEKEKEEDWCRARRRSSRVLDLPRRSQSFLRHFDESNILYLLRFDNLIDMSSNPFQFIPESRRWWWWRYDGGSGEEGGREDGLSIAENDRHNVNDKVNDCNDIR